MASRRRLHLELLEPRHVLSSLLVVNSVSTQLPLAIDGLTIEPFAQVGLSPSALTQQVYDPGQLALLSDPSATTEALVLTFNHPYSPALLLGDTLGTDLQLTGADGRPVIDPLADPPQELTDQPFADAVTRLIVPLIQGDFTDRWQPVPLQPATYHVALAALSNLEFALGGGFPPDMDQPLGQFTVLGRGATLNDSVNLGTLGTGGESVAGTLDPNNYQAALDLYEFHLAPGQLWQVELDVAARGIGSPLLGALTLFDAQGNVLATRDSGSGSLAEPSDPYLVTGLNPGTYYVGVSGAGNLPDVPGGYDPLAGTPGTSGRSQPGGPFPVQLHLIAAPVVERVSLSSFNLDYADPLSTAPTELDLTFSGSVDLSSFFVPDHQQSALQVVDSSGHDWPMTAIGYDASSHRLSFRFNEPLPAGSYTLVVPAQGGLTDSAGLPVLGPPGSPSGVLERWTVAPAPASDSPSDLGVIWPGVVNVTWIPRTTARTVQLAPGQDTAYRFVVICPGIYQVTTAEGSASVQVDRADGTTAVDPGSVSPAAPYLMNLTPGVYSLHFNTFASQPAVLEWRLTPLALDYEKILDNGVGQAPAVGLALVAPGALDAASPSSGLAVNPAILSANPSSSVVSPIPSSLLVTLNTSLMGLPSSDAGHVSAVGPTAEGGLVALADNGAGLVPGIRYGSALGSSPLVGAEDLALLPGAPGAPALVSRDDAPRGQGGASAGGDSADARALARADWLIQLADWLNDGLRSPEPAQPGDPAVHVPLLAMVGNPLAATTQGRRSGPAGWAGSGGWQSLIQDDLGASASLVVAAAVSYRLRRPLRKWWRRHDPGAADRRGSRFFPGRPHFPSGRAGAAGQGRTRSQSA
jgi:hypothetical protein